MMRRRWSRGATQLQVIRAATPLAKSRQPTEKSGVSAGESGVAVLCSTSVLENAVTARAGPNIAQIHAR